MIVVEFQGGLGNQMSQYAMMQLLKNIYRNTEIVANCDFYRDENCHSGFELLQVFPNCIDKSFSKMCILKKIQFLKHQEISQQYLSGYPEVPDVSNLDIRKNILLKGTWHNYNYSMIKKTLLRDFTFDFEWNQCKQDIYNEIISSQSVGIHIRGGDYCQLGLDILNADYYNKAIHIINENVENPIFYIFSDDVFFAQEKLKGVSIERGIYISNNKDYEDLKLMSACKHNIIANSTFSYWAAELNQNPQKIIIRSKYQTKENKSWDKPGWILI